MSKLSTGILINKIKLIDKIDCEIKVAKMGQCRSMKKEYPDGTWKYYSGKLQSLQDLKQWIEDLKKEGE